MKLIKYFFQNVHCSIFSLFSPSWGFGSSEIIQGNEAVFPLCFPGGFPYDSWSGGCYSPESFGGAAYEGNLPCLPPIINGEKIVPCGNPYVTVRSYNGNSGGVVYGPQGGDEYYQYQIGWNRE